MCGTSEHMSPELIRGKGYGKNVDWWACGVLLFEISTGEPPFTGRNRKIIFEKILLGEFDFPVHVSTELQDLINNFLKADENER